MGHDLRGVHPVPAVVSAPANFVGTPVSQSQVNFTWTLLADATGLLLRDGPRRLGQLHRQRRRRRDQRRVRSGKAANTALTRCVSGINPNGGTTPNGIGPGVLITTATFAQTVAVGSLGNPACSARNNCLIAATIRPPATRLPRGT